MSIPVFVSEKSKPEITTRPLSVGCLVFDRMDQIDFTGPFEILSRMPSTTIQIIGKEVEPVRDVQGLRLSPDVRIAEARLFDVLLVPGGYGQQALMHGGDYSMGMRPVGQFAHLAEAGTGDVIENCGEWMMEE